MFDSAMDGIDLNAMLGLGPVSILSWFISTIAGGGSSLLLMPIIGFFLGAGAIAPVTTVGGIFGNIERVIAYRKSIHWGIVFWEAPGAVLGSILGAFTLAHIEVEWIGVLVGLFLVFSALNYFIKNFRPQAEKKQKLTIQTWYFLPAGFIYSILSGIIGSMGSLLAPMYIGFGLQKEELLATQALTRAIIHTVKVFAYFFFGILLTQHLIYGLVTGLTAIPGNWLGHLALQRISEYQFRLLVMGFILVSGLIILWQEFSFLAVS
ncbi:MAG: sulfite exporter TauE/SafE family protein [Prochlorotrichaceae cyanobacterium]|jgi:uncharacterized membrane protein YfcA